MAAHSFLRIGECWLFAARETYVPEFAAIYRDSERTSVPKKEGFGYTVSALEMRQRLNALGYTQQLARQKIHRACVEAEDASIDTFDEWLVRLQEAALGEEKESEEVPIWLAHLDPRLILRGILEAVPDHVEITLDLSDLIDRGFLGESPDFCVSAFRELHAAAAAFGPLIVLTEGSSDAEFLSDGLELLYPHLAGYVTFLDYGYRPEGGAGALVKAVKAFASAGIGHRILALFDNDTGAAEALTGFDPNSLPSNFRIVQLPPLALAESYPTLGPTGQDLGNVNGLACSLEMFLGKDILTAESDRLMPVQWRGYSARLERYQGELLNKGALHALFRQRVAKARAKGLGADEDWTGIRAVLEAILSAF